MAACAVSVLAGTLSQEGGADAHAQVRTRSEVRRAKPAGAGSRGTPATTIRGPGTVTVPGPLPCATRCAVACPCLSTDVRSSNPRHRCVELPVRPRIRGRHRARRGERGAGRERARARVSGLVLAAAVGAGRAAPQVFAQLTSREREVLELVARGLRQRAHRPPSRPVREDGAQQRLPGPGRDGGRDARRGRRPREGRRPRRLTYCSRRSAMPIPARTRNTGVMTPE